MIPPTKAEKVLSSYDDKTLLTFDGIASYPYGRNTVEVSKTIATISKK